MAEGPGGAGEGQGEGTGGLSLWPRRGKRGKGAVPVSQICALIVLPSMETERVANSTPIVDFDSRLNSFRVNRDSRLDLPTPESPITTTEIRERRLSGRRTGEKGAVGECSAG